MGFKDLLARQQADSAEDVLIARTGIDRSGLNVFVSADTLSEPEVPGTSIDVSERAVPKVMEREDSVEVTAILPELESVAEAPKSEPIVLPAHEQRRVDGEALPAITFPFGKFPQLVDKSVGNEHVLGGGLASLSVLEDAESDPSLDEPLTVAGDIDITNVEGEDLERSHASAQGDGEDDVITESVNVLAGDSEQMGLFGFGEGNGRADCSDVTHELPPVEKSIAEQNEYEQQEKTKIRNKAPLAIVKRTEQDFADWIATEAGFLACFGRYEDTEIRFEPYQKEFLATEAGFRCVEKSRQVGYSWLFACEAIARTHLRTMHNSIFVSYNLADSKEKIAYAQQLHEELPLAYQKKMVTDSKLELGFASNGQSKRVSRIYSHPSRAPRGKKGDIYLDELAHYANDTEVYKGSTALVLRSGGQLTVCSSPLGRRGKFWEIARQEVRPYKTFWRQGVPWWLCSMFCCSPEVHYTAHLLAPKMTTEERVYKLGHQRIIEQFESNTLEDFQQEFEVVYIDESMSFFPYSLILPCTNDELELADDISQVQALNGGRLVAAFDVGRKKDLSELVIFEESSPLSVTGSRKIMRYAQAFDKIKFHIQEEACRQMMNLLPIAKFYIDQNGIGMHLAENLADEFPQVFPYTFSGPSKEVLCNDFKIGLQRHEIILPSDRRLVAQIHSIRKKVTPAGRATFDAQDTEDKGHADRFWACAMACQKEREVKQQPAKVTVRIFAG